MDGITRTKISLVMKKLISVLFLLLVITTSYSQNKYKLAFLTSPQVSWLKSDSKGMRGNGGLLGFGYGVEADLFPGSENYALTTGMTVSSAGGSLVYDSSVPFSGKVLPAGTKVDYYLTYLEIPLAVKLISRDFNRTRYYAQFGLTNWLNIRAKGTTSDGLFQKEKIKDEVRFFNAGLNVGAGLAYDLGHGNALTGGIVFSNGFTDATINKGSKDASTLKIVRFRFGFIF
jgi:hypothetical protein